MRKQTSSQATASLLNLLTVRFDKLAEFEKQQCTDWQLGNALYGWVSPRHQQKHTAWSLPLPESVSSRTDCTIHAYAREQDSVAP